MAHFTTLNRLLRVTDELQEVNLPTVEPLYTRWDAGQSTGKYFDRSRLR